jgi:cation:H+ antiporter
VTWGAGIALAQTTDAIDRRFGLGDALGGVVLLAVAGSLPETAITVSAAARGNLDIAAGNLIGGIAMQTMVLVLCDAAASGTEPLTSLVLSLEPALEALLVVLVVAEVLMGALLPEHIRLGPVSPASIAILVSWVVGVRLLGGVRRSPAWRVERADSPPGSPRHRMKRPARPSTWLMSSSGRAITAFVVASALTLAAGVALEESGNTIADRAGINGVLFGATVLAFATALPEISSGLAAVRIGHGGLAIADIFGGNAFQVCLFLVADLVAGRPVLPSAGDANGWLAGLGIVLTVIYASGIVLRDRRSFLRLGIDSLTAVVAFGLGLAGLIAIVHG